MEHTSFPYRFRISRWQPYESCPGGSAACRGEDRKPSPARGGPGTGKPCHPPAIDAGAETVRSGRKSSSYFITDHPQNGTHHLQNQRNDEEKRPRRVQTQPHPGPIKFPGPNSAWKPGDSGNKAQGRSKYKSLYIMPNPPRREAAGGCDWR